MNIKENESYLLDFILNKTIELKRPVNCFDFKAELLLVEQNESDHENEFTRLIAKLEEVANVTYFNDFPNRVEINEKTKDFMKSGGFVKTYKEDSIRIKKELKNKNLSDTKLYFDSKISKLKYVTFWPVFIFGLIGGLYGLYEFITSPKNEKRLNQIELNIQENKMLIKEMRTLVLDQKTVDSSFQRNSEKQTSTQKRN